MSLPPPPQTSLVDPRNVRSGQIISDVGGYYDGQSLVSAGDGILSMVFHHCHNHEGGPGLRLYHMTSRDNGTTWTHPMDTPVHTDLTRPSHDGYQLVHPTKPNTVFLFYGYNNGKLHYDTAISNPSSTLPRGHEDLPRCDMQLDKGFRLMVSTDYGATFPTDNITATVPVRRTEIDENNPWAGSTMGAFCCDKPVVINNAVFFAFEKTREGGGETRYSEIFIMRSKDLLDLDDPSQATWETLPHGNGKGFQWTHATVPGQDSFKLGEEAHVFRTDADDANKICCLWRTECGILAICYSDDLGDSWTEPTVMTYDGTRPIKNPRGAITPHRFADGTVIMIYYNNSHTEKDGYVGRRYYWYTLGRPSNSPTNPTNQMVWSEPELALWYDGEALDERPGWNVDWAIVDGPGYVDFCELPDGKLVFIESNKLTLRFHTVDDRILWLLKNQHKLVNAPAGVPRPCVKVESVTKGLCKRGVQLCDVQTKTGGFTFVLKLAARMENLKPGQIIVDTREIVVAALDEEDGGDYITKGFYIAVEGRGKAGLQLCMFMTDGWRKVKHFCDGMKWDGEDHVVTFTVDCGPRVVLSTVDERLCDGGEFFAEGWTTLDSKFSAIGGADYRFLPEATVRHPHSGDFGGRVSEFRCYNRPLLVGECIGVCREMLMKGGGGSKL
jgi:hypothetical protein